MCAAFRSDKALSPRLDILNLLWRCRQGFPEVVFLVENAAKNDPGKEMRSAATRLLESKPKE